ncbi:hypothetical protein Agabi119p4_10802 [Agaricus bisporus var. burnettii]|uniref:Uncharacterized protein n=1 Tax=Agaricus bisporus var. burnettii TaxID=192524 RepID=A0A8H7C0I1_AGABI|nr:hypothetical protein Agabi119p4_10802 [Agaricus bisporus var. burnettii]
MTRNPLRPRKAWLIGYRIPYETWCQWVPTLAIPEECLLQPGQDLTGIRMHSVYWSYYLEWKYTLRRSVQAKLPKIRYEWLGENAFGAFIPFRWFEYTSQDETNPNDPDYNASVFQERETDRAQLQMLLKFFRKQGAPLDKDKVSFGCMVDTHPHDERTAY